ncbi:MAG: hypothetical protein WCA35_15520, partial [Kovacikia sp.]
VTIYQPDGASPAIPAVILECFNEAGYSRGEIQQITVGDFTPKGVAALKGRALPDRYTHELSVDMLEPDALRLEALIRWQDGRYGSGSDGYLLLIDEVEYAYPSVAPHPKTLLETISTGYGMVYGFPVLKVKIQKGQKPKNHIGQDTLTGYPTKLMQFSCVELP